MRKIALIAGCSHSAGSEIDGTQDSRYNRDHSYGNLLAHKLGYEPVNIAICGATNNGISRSILNWFKEQYDPETMEVFVIVGWTEGGRLEVPIVGPADGASYHTDNAAVDWYDNSAGYFHRLNYGWFGDTPEQKEFIAPYLRFMIDNPLLLETDSVTRVLLIQYYLKSLNIPYVMCHTMHLYTPESLHISYYTSMIDRTCYYELDANDSEAFYWKYRNMGHLNEKAKYWHHGEEPHRLHAEALYTFIKENNNV